MRVTIESNADYLKDAISKLEDLIDHDLNERCLPITSHKLYLAIIDIISDLQEIDFINMER